MLSKNLLTPWTIDLFGCSVIVRHPHWTKRVWPVVVSISRQISFERSANGEYSTPSPTAARVNLNRRSTSGPVAKPPAKIDLSPFELCHIS